MIGDGMLGSSDGLVARSPILALTVNIIQTYTNCSTQFKCPQAPRRVLTKPPMPTRNAGLDNECYDYICRVGEELHNTVKENSYSVVERLGQGCSGQVMRCRSKAFKNDVAVKIIRSKPEYNRMAMGEINLLKLLNENPEKHIVRMLDHFTFQKHVCIVFEALDANLFEVLKLGSLRGTPLPFVRRVAEQLLEALDYLWDLSIIHCDLKPENILMRNLESADVAIIDFGSARVEKCELHTYLQSRFYRSPEVLLGLPLTCSIDMWSLGCIIAELFMGVPVFPGISEYDQVRRIVECLSLPSEEMLINGQQTEIFFSRKVDSGEKETRCNSGFSSGLDNKEAVCSKWRLNTHEEYERKIRKVRPPRTHRSEPGCFRNLQQTGKKSLLHFLHGLFRLDPKDRWTARQASHHPFIKDTAHDENFQPPVYERNPANIPPAELDLKRLGIEKKPTWTNGQDVARHDSPWHPPSPMSMSDPYDSVNSSRNGYDSGHSHVPF